MKNKIRRKSHFTHPTSHIPLHTSQKGITLIALIITIIAMLILVGVSLNIALDDNGIIAKTKEAREKQEKAIIYDQIVAALIFDEDGLNLLESYDSINGTLAQEYTVTMDPNIKTGIGNSFTVTVKGKYAATEKYTITKNGISEQTETPVPEETFSWPIEDTTKYGENKWFKFTGDGGFYQQVYFADRLTNSACLYIEGSYDGSVTNWVKDQNNSNVYTKEINVNGVDYYARLTFYTGDSSKVKFGIFTNSNYTEQTVAERDCSFVVSEE